MPGLPWYGNLSALSFPNAYLFSDYDMCSPCIANRRGRHAMTHEFFEIEGPGRVIVHTDFSGEGERERKPVSFPTYGLGARTSASPTQRRL